LFRHGGIFSESKSITALPSGQQSAISEEAKKSLPVSGFSHVAVKS
jgi:hypothetical protein